MKTLRVVLGDQLSPSLSSLQAIDAKHDVVLMTEVWCEATYVKHHQKKIALVFAAMRHFAAELKQKGFKVHYTKLTDPENIGTLSGEVARYLSQHSIDQVVVTEPAEYRLLNEVNTWQKTLALPVSVLNDDRFLCTPAAFSAWAKDKKQLRMEYFYRHMRQKHQILMQGKQPLGGKWNYDQENRKPAPDGLRIPKPTLFEPDAITQQVLKLVAAEFGDHFGDLKPFHLAVTRVQALKVLRDFINQRLSLFGDYQDAMCSDEPWMFHAHIGFYLNCGLLLPLECVQAAEKAYHAGKAPLNAVEGFVRQVLGWREYVRGLYWLKMPQYAEMNHLNAQRDLPSLYWTGETSMNCLKQCVASTKKYAYAHHIQRLMVLGNFALLTGVAPQQVSEWFMIVYADAYEWVELPNVTGMALFADGGVLASKPYAAGGSYIHKMSNYCQDCQYKVQKKEGAEACPFNYLYWDFLAKQQSKLSKNPRMAMMYRVYDRMTPAKKKQISVDSRRFLEQLD
jgi:deoxyribodipyrimidine photolyase-related protein